MSATIVSAVVEQMTTLPDDLQRQVLVYVYSLKQPKPLGIAGERLTKFAGYIPSHDLDEIRQAIEADCERIDYLRTKISKGA